MLTKYNAQIQKIVVRTLFSLLACLIGYLLLISFVYKSLSFLFGFNSTPTESGLVCARINAAIIWRIGNHADELLKHIYANTSLIIDSSRMSQERLLFESTMDLIARHDPFGFRILLGTHNSNIAVCADTKGLAKGIHTVTVETWTTLGERYSYTWNVNIPG